MPAIITLGRPNLKMISAEMEQALQVVAQKYGVAIRYTGSTFTALNAKTKFEIAVKAPVGTNGQVAQVQTPEVVAFKNRTYEHGMPANALNSVISLQGEKFRIVGYVPRRHKMPISLEKVISGRRVKCSAPMAKNAWVLSGAPTV